MQLNEFLEKFLPDYGKRRKEYYSDPSLGALGRADYAFHETLFPEALSNFADIICKKQRYNCGKEVLYMEWADTFDIEAVESADQPSIAAL